MSAGLGGSFAPSAVIDGRTVTPAGWMWVISFALAGCEWAVTEASKPEFRVQVADQIDTVLGCTRGVPRYAQLCVTRKPAD